VLTLLDRYVYISQSLLQDIPFAESVRVGAMPNVFA
jgi:hypothetical protein